MTPAMIDRLRRLCECVCTTPAMERHIEPTLTDIRNECLEAHDRGRPWKARRIQAVGLLAIMKVIALVMFERGVESALRPDAETQSALRRLGAIFGVAVTMTTVALAWVPFNATPVPHPLDTRELLYLIPQALPIAVSVGLMIAIVLVLEASLSGRLAVWIFSAAVICSVASFLTLGWWAPASNQAYRTKVAGQEIAKGENELTLGELGSRIEQIRAFDPAAPARRLSVLYHTRWALSVTPLVVAVFALVISCRRRRTTWNAVPVALLSSGGFALLLTWTTSLAFRGSVPPPLGAWLPNLAFLGMTAIVVLWSLKHRVGGVDPEGPSCFRASSRVR